MAKFLKHGFVAEPELFSLATMLYTRLRRVMGRVIDVTYALENPEYGHHVCALAMSSEDTELQDLASKIRALLPVPQMEQEIVKDTIFEQDNVLEAAVEPTDDDIYRAQVSHHYIGALR